MKSIIALTAALVISTAALAQHSPLAVGGSPDPYYGAPGNIGQERAYMATKIKRGDCLTGTYVSADVYALALTNRVAPNAQFWTHAAISGLQNAFGGVPQLAGAGSAFSGSPWNTSAVGTVAALQGLPAALKADMLSHIRTTDFVVYLGSDLYKFGYQRC